MSSYNNDNKNKSHPINPLMKSMNDFFQQQPIKRLLDSIDDFFEQPFPIPSIPIDMYETKSELIISADIPGVKREQIFIDVNGFNLKISIDQTEEFEEKNEVKHYFYKKHSFQRASRTVQLPYSVKEQEVKALYRDGVLKISIPKKRKNSIKIDE
ncbi:Hsp20/alpha crystallin family protein [Bacillus timonensis]|nr:Hsp20/alpha crystallin family protein [Bacillus timonensis]